MARLSLRVAVVGCGPSGIAALKNFADAGFDVTGFEMAQGVGGNWRYNDPTGHSSVFSTTHIISSKTNSQYEDFPLPAHYPDYPSHTQLKAYFEAYAGHFGLLPKVRFGTVVHDCTPLGDAAGKPRWRVSFHPRGAPEQISHEDFDALVVCNGHHNQPRWPEYPGIFNGEYLHSHGFKSAEPFKGKRVLVIGGGNSACDCAVECGRVAERVDLSWRRGYWLLPKFLLGKPVDTLPRAGWLPVRLQQWLLESLIKMTQGSNEAAGLPVPDHHIAETHPTVNSELYYYVRHGKVTPRGDVERFDGDCVVFKNGERVIYDTVIACTGYRIVHPFLSKTLIDFENGPVPLYLRMIPANVGRLYFIGLFQPLGCIWPGAELQSKLAAKHLAGQWQPPGELQSLVAQELAQPDVQQLSSARHTITVDDPRFRQRLRAQLRRALT
jgi:hypothetical protein